jgi:hypothetical protein
MSDIGYSAIGAHEGELVQYAKREMRSILCLELAWSYARALSYQWLDSGVVAKALTARANVIVRSDFIAPASPTKLVIGPTLRASFAICWMY